MDRITLRTVARCGVAVCLLFGSTLIFTAETYAEEQADEGVFEEIVVTAKKRSQSIYEVPAAISAFTSEDLEKQGIVDLTDVGKFVPNLNVTGFGAGQTSSVNPFIRGIGLQDHLITTDPGVSIYVDGVYLGRQVGQNWSLANIDRIEVLRGPQGTLYGRNSIGGAINIITKQPGDDEGSRIGFEAGTRGRIKGEFFADQRLTDTVAVSLSGSFTRRDGVGDFVNLPDADVDVGELQEFSGRLSLKWSPSENFSLLLTADGVDGDNGLRPYDTLIDQIPFGGVAAAGFTNADGASSRFDNATGQLDQTEVSNEAFGVSATADWRIDENLNLKVVFSDRNSEYEAGLDDDGFFEDFLSFPEEGFADQTSIEVQLSGVYGNLDFVTGIYYFEEEGENDQPITQFLGFPGTFTIGQESESRAIYGNVGYTFDNGLRIAGGIRFNDDEKEAFVDINDSLINTSEDADFSEVSWDLSASYQISDKLNIWGTIANGYQSGQFPPRPFFLFGFLDFDQPGNVAQPNPFQASDNITALNYEVGIKGELTERLQFAASVFFTQYDDLPLQISTTADGGGFNTENLIVEQDSLGLEIEGSYAVTDAFFINFSLGLIDADVDADNAVAPLTPESTFTFGPEYGFEVAGGGYVSVRADYSFRDDMFGEPSDDPGRFTEIDSRQIVNFDLSYTAPSEAWTVGLYGRNVFDERYDNARLNTGDYVLVILSNDPSEFGLRFSSRF